MISRVLFLNSSLCTFGNVTVSFHSGFRVRGICLVRRLLSALQRKKILVEFYFVQKVYYISCLPRIFGRALFPLLTIVTYGGLTPLPLEYWILFHLQHEYSLILVLNTEYYLILNTLNTEYYLLFGLNIKYFFILKLISQG